MATPLNRGDQSVHSGSERMTQAIKGYNMNGQNVARYRNDASNHYFGKFALIAFTSDFQGAGITVNPAPINNYLLIEMHPMSLAYPTSKLSDAGSFPDGQPDHVALHTKGIDEWRAIFRFARCYAADMELNLIWNQALDTLAIGGMWIGIIWIPKNSSGTAYTSTALTKMQEVLTITNTISDVKNHYRSYKWPAQLIYKKGRNDAEFGTNQRSSLTAHIDIHEAYKFEADDKGVNYDLQDWLISESASVRQDLTVNAPTGRPGSLAACFGKWEVRLYTNDNAYLELGIPEMEVNCVMKITQHCILTENIHRE